MKLAVIGTGYVGLVTGVCLAEIGHTVVCIDIDEDKVATMNKGISPIFEPGLDDLMQSNIERKRLFFTTCHKAALAGADAVYIAVGTPQSADGSADLSYVIQASKDIAAYIQNDIVVITKSTVPVGTNRLIEKTIKENLLVNYKVEIVSNPEFLREGHAISDMFSGDRIVIGAESKESAKLVEEIYQELSVPVFITGIESAELIKYASNAFLATKISFINEMANLCEKVGADVLDVAKGMGMDQRIGGAFLNAGIGYGGSCFPKDTNALLHIAHKNDYNFKIVKSVIDVNKEQPLVLVKKVLSRLSTMKEQNVAVLGLSFKPNTDDMREAPSIQVINELIMAGANIIAYDPVAIENAKGINPAEVQYAESVYDALEGADVCVVLTEWDEFKTLDFRRMKEIMRKPIVFDGRYCLPSEDLKNLGFEYYTVDKNYNGAEQVDKEAIYV